MSDLEPSTEVASPGIDARRRVALAVVLSGIFVTVMDSSIVNVAIPVIRSTLHASFGEAELTVASYALAFSAGMITGGRSWGGKSVKPTSLEVKLMLAIKLPRTGTLIS